MNAKDKEKIEQVADSQTLKQQIVKCLMFCSFAFCLYLLLKTDWKSNNYSNLRAYMDARAQRSENGSDALVAFLVGCYLLIASKIALPTFSTLISDLVRNEDKPEQPVNRRSYRIPLPCALTMGIAGWILFTPYHFLIGVHGDVASGLLTFFIFWIFGMIVDFVFFVVRWLIRNKRMISIKWVYRGIMLILVCSIVLIGISILVDHQTRGNLYFLVKWKAYGIGWYPYLQQ